MAVNAELSDFGPERSGGIEEGDTKTCPYCGAEPGVTQWPQHVAKCKPDTTEYRGRDFADVVGANNKSQ